MKNTKHIASVLSISVSVSILTILTMVICLVACANPNGLHNQQASQITFKFINFDNADDGDYSVPGGFMSKSSWDASNYKYTDKMLTLKDGEGTTTVTQTCILREFEFSLVPVGSWSRTWYPGIKGNAADVQSGGKYHNFGVWESNAITLGIPATVTIDGSTEPVTITVQQ